MHPRRTPSHGLALVDVRRNVAAASCCGPPGRHCSAQQSDAPLWIGGSRPTRSRGFWFPGRRADMCTWRPCCALRAHSRAAGPRPRQARWHVPLRAVPAASGGTRGARALSSCCGELTRAGRAGAGRRGWKKAHSPPTGAAGGRASCATRRGINALWCDAGGRLLGGVGGVRPTAGRRLARERRRARPCQACGGG
jgi:hypothetical protein